MGKVSLQFLDRRLPLAETGPKGKNLFSAHGATLVLGCFRKTAQRGANPAVINFFRKLEGDQIAPGKVHSEDIRSPQVGGPKSGQKQKP